MSGCCVCGCCENVSGDDGGVVAIGRKRHMCSYLFTSRAYFRCKGKTTGTESAAEQNELLAAVYLDNSHN